LWRARWAALFAAVLFSAVLAGSSRAQVSHEQVRAEIEQTQRGIERASDYLHESPCVAGQGLLNRAEDLQSRAREQFARRTDPGDRAALAFTREARKLVTSALRACGSAGRSRDDLEGLLHSTEDLISDCRERLTQTPDADAAQLVDAAREQLSRAREAYAKKQLRPALRRLAVARALAQRALHRLRAPAATDRVEAVLDRSDAAVADLRLLLGREENEKAARLIEQATEQTRKAREHWRGGRPRLALRAAAIARVLTLEAQWELVSTPEPEEVEQAVAAVGDLIAEIEPELRADGTATALELLDTARARWTAARAALTAQDLVQAAAEARAAESLLKRAAEEAGLR